LHTRLLKTDQVNTCDFAVTLKKSDVDFAERRSFSHVVTLSVKRYDSQFFSYQTTKEAQDNS